MKIILTCSSDYMAIPAAVKLQEAGMLACVVIPARHRQRLLPAFVQGGITSHSIHAVGKDDIEESLSGLIKEHSADCVFVITFPWKISSELLALPPYGFINFHPGILPKYKGADPIFWQLKNRETNGGITVHRMTDEMDAGPILMQQTLPIVKGETYGMHHSRLGIVAADLVLQVAELAKDTATEQEQDNNTDALYYKSPGKHQVTINWETHASEEIEALVNAANPKYNGAFTSIRNMQLAILEIGFADVTDAPAGIVPGTIVYSDALYGPIVACADGKFVKINTVSLPEGYVSGSKLFSLGLVAGERFT
jgi:methionyl-tRNA formyltransferase